MSLLQLLASCSFDGKAYHVSIERTGAAAERFQIIFAVNCTTTDRHSFLFFSFLFLFSRKDIFILLYCPGATTWIRHSKNFAVRCCQQLLGCHPTTRIARIQVLMPNHCRLTFVTHLKSVHAVSGEQIWPIYRNTLAVLDSLHANYAINASSSCCREASSLWGNICKKLHL